MIRRSLAVVALLAGFACIPGYAVGDAKPDPAQIEFFEKQVRPLLVAQCIRCHGPEKQKGGLRLDSRPAMLSGGESGPAMVAGHPDESRLIKAIRYAGEVQMPPAKKLSDEQVAALAAWVKMGLPWPESPAPTAKTLSSRAPKPTRRMA